MSAAPQQATPASDARIATIRTEPVDAMGIPLSCGKPLCCPGNHHPFCRLSALATKEIA